MSLLLLASFPGRSCLQFLIAYCMQKRRGKAWEKESHVWRQVDMRGGGAVPNRNSQTSRWSASSLPNSELYWHCLLNVTVLSSWTKYYKKDLKSLHQAPPPSCLPSRLPDVTHVTLSSRPSPSAFAYSMWSKTGGRNGLGIRLRCCYVGQFKIRPKRSLHNWTQYND